jgi:hypothetical protein
MKELPGREFAQELIAASHKLARKTSIEVVIAAVKAGLFGDDEEFRLVGRLWTLERMLYYVYGDWGKSLTLNDLPHSPKYLFSKQVYDDSTHEKLYVDHMLRNGWVSSQKEAFRHPNCKYSVSSGLASYTFSLINMGTYPHYVRVAALNLGSKIMELGWMEGLVEVLPDGDLRSMIASQFAENRSHINMGRRVVEELVRTPFDISLCQWAHSSVTRDYLRCLEEMTDFVLQRKVEEVKPIPVIIVD